MMENKVCASFFGNSYKNISHSFSFNTLVPFSQASETTKKRQREDASEWESDKETSSFNNDLNWGETPIPSASSFTATTPLSKKKIAPSSLYSSSSSTPSFTPSSIRNSRWDVTPSGDISLATPIITPSSFSSSSIASNLHDRNEFLLDDDIDSILSLHGYSIISPPLSYVPLRTPTRRIVSFTPSPSSFFFIQDDSSRPPSSDHPIISQADLAFFPTFNCNPEDLGPEELKENKIKHLLLKVKNGNPAMRKSALRQLTSKAREFGPGPLFDSILPLLLAPTLDDQERHLLVKVIDRVLFKLDDLVRPYTHKILVCVEPYLIDEELHTRAEGREIISNLSKAVGLAAMIATLRPDIDSEDEYVRNVTSRTFAVVASALGIPPLIPFLTAVCRTKKSWQAKHTGIKIVQQIAILMGCAVLPHLSSLVGMISKVLKEDESPKLKTITALALAALAEASAPFGVEAFSSVIPLLMNGVHDQRGKILAAYVKALGFIIPLMEDSNASFYSRKLIPVLVRQFNTTEPEMKIIILKVLRQTLNTEGLESTFIREKVLSPFFEHMWSRRMALDKRSYMQLLETATCIANRVGSVEIISQVVDDLKDESEQYRKLAIEAIEQVVMHLGASEIDSRLEERIVDGIMFAFQETNLDSKTMLRSFGTIINSLGIRAKPYMAQICGIIKFRLNNKSYKIRQQAADLVSQLAFVMKSCGEENLMAHLGVILYEYLGEEFPEVLGSILGALKSIVNVIGLKNMQPPIKDLLPRLVPILKNRHENVQENCIDLVGRIADRGSEFVSAREWMRICFQLTDLIRAHKLSIRRAAVNTFGYIAKAIGPQDVLSLLLNNLKVQERQSRVCTCVAIAVVAEICSPFTVIPFLSHEYRTPDLNVQNGVLKALSFMFEYIGEMGKDYIYSIVPLLEDALMDRDMVHRQLAANVVKHAALHLSGLGCEDCLIHLLNYIWPNVFETSPHVVNSAFEAIEALRFALGPVVILQYSLQGLFHPSRKVREVYWRIYNSLYIGAQDMLITGWARMEDVQANTFCRWELDYFV